MIKIIYNVCGEHAMLYITLTQRNPRVGVVTETGSVYPRRH